MLRYLKHTMNYALRYMIYPPVLEGYCDANWISTTSEKVEWLKSFLECNNLWPKLVTSICIHCDNMAAITRAKNQISDGKSRHIKHIKLETEKLPEIPNVGDWF
ncbi:hypothetical protein LXL04_024589 [Taraxacum kok-saghyz]